MICDFCKENKKTVFTIPEELFHVKGIENILKEPIKKVCIKCLDALDEAVNVFDVVDKLEIFGDGTKWQIKRYRDNKELIKSLKSKLKNLEDTKKGIEDTLTEETKQLYINEMSGLASINKEIQEINEQIKKLK